MLDRPDDIAQAGETVMALKNCDIDWGYCSTVHKAQGSEWSRVALIDEYTRPEYPRAWRYTGLSRASQSVVVQRSIDRRSLAFKVASVRAVRKTLLHPWRILPG